MFIEYIKEKPKQTPKQTNKETYNQNQNQTKPSYKTPNNKKTQIPFFSCLAYEVLVLPLDT